RMTPVWRAKDLVVVGHRGDDRSVPIDATALSAWANLGPAPMCAPWLIDDPPERCRGGGPHSGRIVAVAAHPTHPGTMYVGSPGGGVWKTTDGAQHWAPLFDHMPTMQVGSLAIDPFDPERVFAGTGSKVEWSGYLGLGLYLSENGGQTWSQAGGTMFDGCTIDRIAPHPHTRDVMVLAAQVAWESATCQGGVYASVDGGKTWKRWLDRARAWDVEIAGGAVYAGVHEEGVYRSAILMTAKGKPVLGSGWTQVGGGLPMSQTGRVDVASAPSDPQRLYAVMGHAEGTSPAFLQGGWTSADGGASWTEMNIPTTPDTFLSLAVSPTTPTEVHLGALTAWRSVDAGQTFTQGETLHVDVSALEFDAAGRLLAGTDGGLYRAAGFPAFESLNTDLSTMLVYAISGTLAEDGSILAGMQDNGTAHYTGSLEWNDIGTGDGGRNAVDPRNLDRLYVTSNGLAPRRTEDAGMTFTGLSHPDWSSPTTPRRFVAAFSMDLARPDRLYIGTDRLWRSLNRGDLWTPMGPSGTNPDAIGPAESNPDVVYHTAVVPGDRLRVTTDGGTTWSAGGWNAPGYPVDVAVHPHHANQAWVAISGFGHGHLSFTTDYGQTWTDVTGTLPDAPVNAVAVDPRRSPPTLFVGNDVGVFVSFDNGKHWARTGGGLPNTAVNDLLMDRATGYLLAATYGRGVWAAEVQVDHQEVPQANAQDAKKALQAHAEAYSGQQPPLAP
ncbi:MAG TPA: hypothetical protein VGB28_09345, partial [Actinomycetota bacterium]